MCALCVLYIFDVNADRTIASDDVERDGTLYIEVRRHQHRDTDDLTSC